MDTEQMRTNVADYLGARSPEARYSSWDYCYNHFRRYVSDPGALCDPNHIELACLELGFYLASWGMYRGSADLLRRSARHLVPVIEAISAAPVEMWTLDVGEYRNGGDELILGFHQRLRQVLPGATITLTTKIMLGVYGCVPAYDTRFRRGFAGATTFSRGSLGRIAAFYDQHRQEVDHYRVPTLDFRTGEETDCTYTAAKVMDMIFFIEGGRSRSL